MLIVRPKMLIDDEIMQLNSRGHSLFVCLFICFVLFLNHERFYHTVQCIRRSRYTYCERAAFAIRGQPAKQWNY